MSTYPANESPVTTGLEPDGADRSEIHDTLQVVALGASAGGLEALEKFFDNFPPDSGIAFVVIQHLSPDFKSLMNELLVRHTQITIYPVVDGMAIEPNAIYLIPPKKEMIVSNGKLLLTDKDPSQGLSLPIDTFMRSLAQDFGERAIGVILSGTGSDGSRGIKAIHEAGGFVIVQDEESADFDGMPRSAIHTGIVDAVLPPHLMAEAILRHVNQDEADSPSSATLMTEAGLAEVVTALREAYGIDFSHYRSSTVSRRIERRLQLSGSTDLNEYFRNVLANKQELDALYHDLLIGVTKFFRDTDAFRVLEKEVVPQLVKGISEENELRIWVAGCATGEEAYSLAIILHEALANRSRPVNIKIFATDVHHSSLAVASNGSYKADSLTDVSPERLDRYFVRNGEGYQVSQMLRKMIVFAPHNVVRDAPFTNLDFISCRNLLIYLQPDAQKRALSLFHFGLRAGGVLFLGPSESTGELDEEFETVDRHWKVFRKRRYVRLPVNMRLPLSPGLDRLRTTTSSVRPPVRGIPEIHLLRAYDALLEHFIPAGWLVDKHRRLIHSFAGAGKLLKIPDGRPSDDILEFVDPDLKLVLAGALQRASRDIQDAVYNNVRCPSIDESQLFRLSITPIAIQTTGDHYYLIALEPQRIPSNAANDVNEVTVDEASFDRIRALEEELAYTKENLQATVEEMETTNEELQAANEELVASNEELQSTNEELHSVNEELYTVNAEHQRKITELTELTDDMDNLLRSTDIATIFLDRDLNIRKFTPQISSVFQVLPQDVGRPLESFTHNIQRAELIDDVKGVIQSEEPFEKNVQDRQGVWFLLRILPYRSKGQVDGAVLTLIDVDVLKRSEEQCRRLSKVFRESADPIIIEDLEGHIVELNAEAERTYGWSREELLGKKITVLVPRDRIAEAMELRKRCLKLESLRNVETMRQTRSGRVHPVLLTLSLLNGKEGNPVAIATIAKDITARKVAEEEARKEVRRRDVFLAVLSHELRNPLGAVANATRVLEHQEASPVVVSQALEVIRRQTNQMARLLEDLLDVSRVTQGKIAIRKEIVDLSKLARETADAVLPEFEQRRHTLRVEAPDAPLWVEGDPSRLLQIQENLLTNAAKYTPNGGEVSLCLSREYGKAVLRVKDNGLGISPELLPSVFDLFVQGEKPIDRADGGMGVGLSLVRMLVELHGGHVSAHSEGPGRGCEFTVRLPLTVNEPPRDSEAEQAPVDKTARVLIVEDNDDSRRMLEQLLQLDGYQVAVATDGESGFAAIERGAADVALVDIGLPKMDGYQLARKVRADLPGQPIRLVALTGYGQVEDRQKVLNAGFDEHLVKPVAPSELTRALRKPD